MKRTPGLVIDLTDDTEIPKRNRSNTIDPVVVLGSNDIAEQYCSNNNNNNNYNTNYSYNSINLDHNNNHNNSTTNNYNNFIYNPTYNNNSHNLNTNTHNLNNNGYIPNNSFTESNIIQNNINNINNNNNNTFNNNNHSIDKQEDVEANNPDFNRLLSFFTPIPVDGTTSPFTTSTSSTAGLYTPPNLRIPKPPPSHPSPASSPSSSYFPTPPSDHSSLPPIIKLDGTAVFSQLYPPVPPSPSLSSSSSSTHKPTSLSYSSLPPSTLFPLTDATNTNINTFNNTNNINNERSINITFVDDTNTRKRKEKDPCRVFHVYDPRKAPSNSENRNALQRINSFLNQSHTSNNNNCTNHVSNNSIQSNNISINNNNNIKNNHVHAAPVMIDLSNINDDDEEEVYFGNLRIKLAGLQFYSGVVSKEENVSIVREALDPQDPNSFAVFNILNVQVGHLDKHPASILAPLVDSSKLRIEGVIPVPKGDLLVQCYGKISDRDDVVSKLRALDLEIGARLDKTELEKLQQNRVKVDKFNMQPDEMLSIPLSGDDLPLTEPPVGLVSPLYPHQRQALTWMLDRERNRPSTLFWKKRGNAYVNSATNSVVPTPPADCRGGILGDEMGLGKTLEVISLVLASKNADTASSVKSGPSMVVCPLSTLSNWSDQITKHCASNQLSVYLYHGASRTADVALLSSHDIIVTTYNIVGLEFASNARVPSPLYTIVWKRVVLDEAHLIKNRSTQQTQAAWGLRASSKWCLTGTPIQNKIDDLYSLLRFIQLEPFTDFNWWNRLIARPIKNKDLSGYSRLKAILQHVILRRTKEKHIDLPPRTVYMQTLDFSMEERAYYDSLYRFGKAQFDQYARSGSVLQHYAHVLELLLRLRQTCNHPELVPASSFTSLSHLPPHDEKEKDSDDPSKRAVTDLLKTGELDECCICMDKAIDPVATKCVHIFCKTCIYQAISMSGNSCPLCRAPVLPRELYPVKFSDAEHTKLNVTNHKSSKVDALMLDLRSVRERDNTIKSIIFSQFTSFLDIIQQCLLTHGFRYVRLDGKMSHDQRQESIKRFEDDPSVSLFLLSLKAGGVGLNLVSASRVYMMDPWWNPAVEDQAIDRVHRLGQTRPVEVIRFVIRNTVEEKIMKLQQRKMEMAASALEAKSKAQLQEMRLDDLNLLFS